MRRCVIVLLTTYIKALIYSLFWLVVDLTQAIRLKRPMYIGLSLIRKYDCEQKYFTILLWVSFAKISSDSAGRLRPPDTLTSQQIFYYITVLLYRLKLILVTGYLNFSCQCAYFQRKIVSLIY